MRKPMAVEWPGEEGQVIGRSRRITWHSVLAAFLPIILTAGAGLALYNQNWSAYRMAVRPQALPFFAAAAGANLASLTMAMTSWRTLLADGGPPVGLTMSGRLYAANLLGRYLPGRVWGLLAQIRIGAPAGLATGRLVTAYFLTMVVALLTAAAVSVVGASAVFGGQALWLLVPTLFVAGWLIRPDRVARLVGRVLTLMRRTTPLTWASPRAMRRSIVSSLAAWLIAGLHLWVLALFLGAPALRALPLCTGAFALSMVLGSVAVFVPDGWGVREGVLTVALANVLPWSAAVTASIASRVVIVSSELAAAGLMVLAARVARTGRRREPDLDPEAPSTVPSSQGERPNPPARWRMGEETPVDSRPLVSVIVPNHNLASSLRLCIEAIKAQTYSPVEIVIVDDCSTDESVSVAEAAGVTVVSTPVNGGSAVARNLGAEYASGEVLFFVDSDVALAPDAVANGVALLDGDPNLGAVCGIEDPDPLVRDSSVEDYRALQHHYWSISSEGEVSFLWSAMCLIRAGVFAEIGPFNPALRYTEEVDYGHRLRQRYTMLATSTIHGRQDHEHRLSTLLRKIFHRGRYRVPLYARRRRFARGYETSTRAWGSLSALLAVAGLPLLLPFGGVWAAVPAGLVLVSLACDAGMYRFVFRRRRLGFGLFFIGLHFLVNLVIAGSIVAGLLQWVASARFRGTYDAVVPVPNEVG